MTLKFIFGILAIISAILLTLIVIVQNHKGGGLSSAFGASGISSVIGQRRSTQEIEKWTWYLAVGLMLFSFFSTGRIVGPNAGGRKSKVSQAAKDLNFSPTSLPGIYQPEQSPENPGGQPVPGGDN